METIYYDLDARRLTVYDMASGETAPQSCICLHKQEKTAAPAGVLLDLDAYRRRLAEETGEELMAEAAPVRAKAVRPARRRMRPAGLALDLCATLAIVVMAVVVVAGFIPFL